MTSSAASTQSIESPGRGIAYAVAGVLVFSAQDALAKWLVADYSVMQIVFVRGIFALIPCAVIVHNSGGWAALRIRRLHLHAARAVLMIGALICYYLAIRTMPLADAMTIAFAAPLFMTALSVPLLGEHVGQRRWAAVVVGFIGVIIVARPGAGVIDVAALLAVASSLCYAGATIVTRNLTRSESSAAIIMFFSLFTIAATAGFMPFQWITPDPMDAALLASVGLICGVGAFLVIQSLRHAPVSVIAPYDYSGLVWATLFGFWFWGDVPGTAVLAGAAVIIGSNLYIVKRETGGARTAEPKRPRDIG